MPFVGAANVARCAIEGMVDGQLVVNTLWFQHGAGAIDIFSITDLANTLKLDWRDNIVPLLTEGYDLVQVVCRDYTSQFGVAASNAAAGITGGITGESAPNNSACAISFQTGHSGRGLRGRNFIGPIPNSKVVGNDVDATWVGDLLAGYAAISADLLTIGWDHVIVNFQSGGIVLAEGQPYHITQYGVSDLIADSMRRRLPGRGA